MTKTNTMTVEEIQKQLNGCEVISLSCEGVVYVSNGKVIRDGEDITESVDWQELWDEYTDNELGPDERNWY
jgi:hypothetical protein